MDAKRLVDMIASDFYVGVPDSQLRELCDCLMVQYGTDPQHHIIAANEGNCTAIAAGYHLATGKVPVVYMQNSGEGNIVNPVCSLLNDEVYAIPVLFVIGWRGEAGVHDEPQHIYQGRITLKLLADLGIESFVIGEDTAESEVETALDGFRRLFSEGKCAAFVVRKNALQFDKKVAYRNSYAMLREEIIQHITAVSGDDPIVSTTGKASRELFEIRERNKEGHGRDFLTVGSMGHSSSIALGIALNKPQKKVWCVDGDGAALMHMGAMAVVGGIKPKNYIHIIINNEAHETVGGMPTAANAIDLVKIALGCGYDYAVCVDDLAMLDKELKAARQRNGLTLVEVKSAIGARSDLGRPTTSAVENKKGFMQYLKEL